MNDDKYKNTVGYLISSPPQRVIRAKKAIHKYLTDRGTAIVDALQVLPPSSPDLGIDWTPLGRQHIVEVSTTWIQARLNELPNIVTIKDLAAWIKQHRLDSIPLLDEDKDDEA